MSAKKRSAELTPAEREAVRDIARYMLARVSQLPAGSATAQRMAASAERTMLRLSPREEAHG